MKSNLVLAGLILSTTPAMAQSPAIPEICTSVANYTAQTLGLTFTDGSWEGPYDPRDLTIKKNPNQYPIQKVQDLGNCETNSSLKPSWCNVAGGAPEVYQIDVEKPDSFNKPYPFATIIVTYNRGGCWVDEASRK